MRSRLKALAADVLSMTAAVVVLTAIVALPWLIFAPWWLPTSGTSERWSHVPSLILYAAPVCVALGASGALAFAALGGYKRRNEATRWRRAVWAPLGSVVVVGLASYGVTQSDSLTVLIAMLNLNKVWVVALVAATSVILLALAAWLVSLTRRHLAWPLATSFFTAVVLSSLWLCCRVVLDAWGDRIRREFVATTQRDVVTERIRIAADRRPVLFGEPIEERSATGGRGPRVRSGRP